MQQAVIGKEKLNMDLNGIYFWIVARFDALKARSESGAAAVEYGLLVGLIAVAIIVTLGLLGTKLNTMFASVCAKLPVVSTTC
jgi:pilus assembly protein Flp/PilA